MSLLAEHVEEPYRTRLELGVLYSKLRQTFLYESAHLASLADARHIAFHVGHETGDTNLAERLGQHLESYGLTRTCGTCHKTVAVGHLANYAQWASLAMGNV